MFIKILRLLPYVRRLESERDLYRGQAGDGYRQFNSAMRVIQYSINGLSNYSESRADLLRRLQYFVIHGEVIQ